MEIFMKENGKMIKKMDLVHFVQKIKIKNIKDIG